MKLFNTRLNHKGITPAFTPAFTPALALALCWLTGVAWAAPTTTPTTTTPAPTTTTTPALTPPKAPLPSIEDFAKNDQWTDVKVSPTGEYLSAVTRIDGKRVIVFFDLNDGLKAMHWLKFNDYAQSGKYYWAGSQRIVTQKEYLKGWSEWPINYGEFFAVNVDGSNPQYIFGYQDAKKTGGHRMWGTMIDPLPADDRHVLIEGTRMSKKDYPTSAYRVNIITARRTKVVDAPVAKSRFLTDNDGNIRFVTGINDQAKYQTFLYDQDKWLSTKDLAIDNDSFYPMIFHPSGDKVYATYATDGEPDGIYLFDLTSGEKTKLSSHPRVSPSYIRHSNDGQVYAVEYEQGYTTIQINDPNNPDAVVLKGLMAALEGYNVSLVSESLDGNIKVVFIDNQYSPGEYLLFNKKKKQLDPLFAVREWVNAQYTASVVPFEYKARDGLPIDAYVTLPVGVETLKDAAKLPFIINVHGGPHGIRDNLSYDSENQLYASRGIGVLQVNFRGSGGYGNNFAEKGYGHWGDQIQFDIIDGVKALIAQGVADKDRFCIIGASFGGYSALQSAILEPSLFRCAIGSMGVYDLGLMYEIGSISNNQHGREYLKEAIGNDKDNLKAFSPLYHIDQLKTPVFIIHGDRDERVPMEHSELLKAQLDKHKRPYQWMILEDEDHGFYNPKNRAKVFERSLAFVAQYLGVKL